MSSDALPSTPALAATIRSTYKKDDMNPDTFTTTPQSATRLTATPYCEQTTAGRVLLALRAGPIERAGLRERLGGAADSAVKNLLKQDLITVHNGYAQITRAGLRQCPSRRSGPVRQGVHKR